MSSQVQNLPTGGGHQDQVSSTSRDTAAQQTSEARQANNAGATTATASSSPPPPPQPAYGQQQQAPYVPYAGHPSQPYTTPIRPLPEQSRLYIAAKLGLTALSIVWSIVIVAITSVLLNTGVSGAVVALYTYVIVAASILWNAAELITYCVRVRRQTNRAIHPGAHVGLHLIFWLVGAFAILLTVSAYQGESYVIESCERSNQDDDRDSYRYSGYNYCDDYYQYEDYRSVLSLLRALLAIFVIWTLNHFILFVLACTDTHKRNSMRPAAFVVPVAAMPAQGMYYPQQQASAQPMQQYYPYPVMMQPPAVANGTQPAQPAQNFAGFYAPSAPGTSTQAPN